MMLLLNGSNSVLHLPNITEAGEYTCWITYPDGEVQTYTTTISHPSIPAAAAAAAAAGVIVTLVVVVFLVILAGVIVWR